MTIREKLTENDVKALDFLINEKIDQWFDETMREMKPVDATGKGIKIAQDVVESWMNSQSQDLEKLIPFD